MLHTASLAHLLAVNLHLMNSLSYNFSALQLEELSALINYELRCPLRTLEDTVHFLSSGESDRLSPEGNRLLDQALVSLDRLTRLTHIVNESRIVDDPSLSPEQIRLLQLKRDLPKAIDNGEFYLAYQPIIAATTKTIVGLEALARWNHPVYGLIPPTVFIPLAEETNMIHLLGKQLLEQACYQLRRWQDQFPDQPSLQVSVNVSVIQFLQLDFPWHVEAVLKASQIDPSNLKLEITESALLENNSVVSLVLEKLGRLGVKLYMDDFGTGYSTLARLQMLPVDTLKLDRSFVINQNWEICEVILDLSKRLNFHVIVEGVETQSEMLKLQEIGLPMMQGYYFFPPLDVESMSTLLAHFHSPRANSIGNLPSAEMPVVI